MTRGGGVKKIFAIFAVTSLMDDPLRQIKFLDVDLNFPSFQLFIIESSSTSKNFI